MIEINFESQTLEALVDGGFDPERGAVFVAEGVMEYLTPEKASGGAVRQKVTIRQGLSVELSKQIVKAIKAKKLKVQAAIQGEELRVSGKKRDDLQAVIALIKEMKLDQPLQYVNMRD